MGHILAFPIAPFPAETAPLSQPERLALAAFRLWLAAIRREDDPVAALEPLFADAEVRDAAAASTDALMHIIARTARDSVDLRCPHCPHLSPDEALLLHAIGTAQRGEENSAEHALLTLLNERGASFARSPLCGLAHFLAEAHLRLPRRRPPENRRVVH